MIARGRTRVSGLARLLERPRRDRLELRPLQVLLVEELVLGRVLHDEHRVTLRVGRRHLGRRRLVVRQRRRGARPARRSTRRPARSATETWPPSSSASFRRERQARGPVPFTRACTALLDLGELLEDPLLVLGRRCRSRCRRPRTRPSPPDSIRARRHPDLAALGELERVRDEVAQDLRDLALVGVEAAAGRRAPRTRGSRRRSRAAGRSMPRSAPNRSGDLERRRADDDLAGLDLGEVEQVVDQLRQVLGRLADEARPASPARR